MYEITNVLNTGPYFFVDTTQARDLRIPRGLLTSYLQKGRFLEKSKKDGKTEFRVYDIDGKTELASEVFNF